MPRLFQRLGLNREEDEFLQNVIEDIALSSITTTSKTLMQLGYEPFPLTMGKTPTGRSAYFIPNEFSYAWQLAKSHPLGWSVLTTGYDARSLAIIINWYTFRWATMHFVAFFGYSPHAGVDECQLTDLQSFRRALRWAMRDSLASTVASFAARPFTVVCIRQIAQLIGGETKYLNAYQSLRLIIAEEGIGALFSGFIPSLYSQLLIVWGSAVFSLAAERLLNRLANRPANVRCNQKWSHATIFVLAPHIGKFFSRSFFYSAVSTVMACVGSGLAVSCLPYNPTFNNWFECYEYLRPLGHRRGAKLFRREHTGTDFAGMDKQLYASNKH